MPTLLSHLSYEIIGKTYKQTKTTSTSLHDTNNVFFLLIPAIISHNLVLRISCVERKLMVPSNWINGIVDGYKTNVRIYARSGWLRFTSSKIWPRNPLWTFMPSNLLDDYVHVSVRLLLFLLRNKNQFCLANTTQSYKYFSFLFQGIWSLVVDTLPLNSS